jgi:hypothetical protein
VSNLLHAPGAEYSLRPDPWIFGSRRSLLLEVLALRQQTAVLKANHPGTAYSSGVFWLVLRRFWLGWKQALVIMQPEMVIRHTVGADCVPVFGQKGFLWSAWLGNRTIHNSFREAQQLLNSKIEQRDYGRFSRAAVMSLN